MRSFSRYLTLLIFSVILLIYVLYYKEDRSTQNLNDKSLGDVVRVSKVESTFDSIDQVRARQVSDLMKKQVQNRYENLIDYIDFPARSYPYNFRNCRMSNCFDYTLCETNEPVKINIIPTINVETNLSSLGENNLIYRYILDIIRNSSHYESDPEKACLFILEDDTLDRDPLSQSFQGHINGRLGYIDRFGMNHLVFNLFSGSWPDYAEDDFAGFFPGASIIAKASSSLQHHRPEFDISLPLFSHLHPIKINDNDIDDILLNETRKYLLSFKGKRYTIGRGSEARNYLHHIHNGKDVIMVSTCRHGKKWQDSYDERCANDELEYSKYDFNDLMKESIFCLVPRGRRNGSFRFLEALNHGCIPVILSNGWVKPFVEIIDWSQAVVQFDERLTSLVPDFLRDISPETVVRLRQNGRSIYRKYLASIERIVITTLEIIDTRIKRQIFLKP